MSNADPQDYLNQFNDNAQKMLQPWAKLNQAFLRNAEMMTDFSLNTIKTYSEMSLDNLREVAKVDSPESAKEFSSKQAEILKEVSQKMLADAQKLTELGSCMQDEIMQVMGDVYEETSEQVQSTMQQTTEQATKNAQEYAQNMNKMAEQVAEKASEAVKTAAQSNATSSSTTNNASSANNSSSSTDKTSSKKP